MRIINLTRSLVITSATVLTAFGQSPSAPPATSPAQDQSTHGWRRVTDPAPPATDSMPSTATAQATTPYPDQPTSPGEGSPPVTGYPADPDPGRGGLAAYGQTRYPDQQIPRGSYPPPPNYAQNAPPNYAQNGSPNYAQNAPPIP